MLDQKNIIESYRASKVSIPDKMIRWMRSNHAGETGAVWIYIGARCIFWNKSIRNMAKEHFITEKKHLIVMSYILPSSKRSKLLILWRILGFSLGFIAAFFGYRFFCITIQSVESFVEKHYQDQIDFLYKNSLSFDLLQVLEICCNEEIQHQLEAKKDKGSKLNNTYENLWSCLIGKGSSLAVNISRFI